MTQAAIDEIMKSLGRKLGPDVAQEVAQAVPPALALPVRSGVAEQQSESFESLYERVCEATGWEAPRAREFTQLVLHVVAQALDGSSLDRTRQGLPEAWSGKLDREPPKDLSAVVRPPPSEVVQNRSLTRGPIGAKREEDARDGASQDAEDHGSPARPGDDGTPRHDTLASGGQPAPAGEGQTLADGRRGSRRPLSSGK